MRMKLTYLLVSPLSGICRTMLGAVVSSPGLALPKSRMERSLPGMDGRASLRLLIRGEEELLLAFLCVSRSCCTTAAIFLLCTGAGIAEANEATADAGMVVMCVKAFETLAGSGLGAGGGGGGRLASTMAGLVMCCGALRTGCEGEGGIDVDSWNRDCVVVLWYEVCDAAGEIMLLAGGGSTKLAIDGDALARLTI